MSIQHIYEVHGDLLATLANGSTQRLIKSGNGLWIGRKSTTQPPGDGGGGIDPPPPGEVPNTYPGLAYMTGVTTGTATKAKLIMDYVYLTLGRVPGVVWGYAEGAEHGTGRALDFMVSQHGWNGLDSQMGDLITSYVISRAAEWHLNWVIWAQRLYYPDGSSYLMEDRGSITQNHFDHPHVFFASD